MPNLSNVSTPSRMPGLSLALTLLAALGVRAADGPGTLDPLQFVMPTDPPAFEDRTRSNEVSARLAAVRADLGDFDKLAKSSIPAAGTRIRRVEAKSQAVELKLKAGDIIWKIDGAPLEQANLNALRTEADQSMTIVEKDGAVHDVTIHPGLVGVGLQTYVRPELVYLRHGNRNAKWDEPAAVGAALCRSEPTLAEAAWRRAFDAGYVADAVSDYCGVQVAWRTGRPNDAVAFCALLGTRKDVPAALDADRLAREVAISNFKIEQALGSRMAVDPPVIELTLPDAGDRLQALLEAYRRLPEATRHAPSPSEVAAYVKANLLKDIKPFPDKRPAYRRSNEELTGLISHDKPLGFDAPSNHFQEYACMPKDEAADVELTIRSRLRVTKPVRPGGSLAALAISLVDADGPQQPDRAANEQDDERHHPFVTLLLDADGMANVQQQGYAGEAAQVMQYVDVAEATNDARPFTARILHCGNRDEVWLNDRRLLYLPTERLPHKVGFHLIANGLTTEASIDFQKLDPTQVPGRS